MKKLIIRMLATVVVLGLVGCGQKGPLRPADDNEQATITE
ncbi:MAG: lipoprotein [Gammaproteobacteria bacterium]|nr:lipoprotein [Gammaproteobacteria bacterium]NVK86930.1 lipoprotein [Gammaproteobacteria bacterium]